MPYAKGKKMPYKGKSDKGKRGDKRDVCPGCGSKLDSKGMCKSCGYRMKKK